MSDDVTYPAVMPAKQVGQFAAALARAQGEIRGAIKDSENPYFHSKYADLAAVWDACRKPLSDNEICVVQKPRTEILEYEIPAVPADGNRPAKPASTGFRAKVTVATRLIHSSGEYEDSDDFTALTADAGPQAVGSATTYLRRYSLASMCGVAPEDDDGNAAQPKPPEERTSENAGLTRGAQRGADYLATRPPSNGQDRQSDPAQAVKAIDQQMAKADAQTLTKRVRCLKAAADHGLKSTDLAKKLAELGWPDNPKDLTDEQVVAIETTKMAEYAARLVGAPAVLPDGALSAVGEAQARESEYLTDPEEEIA